MHCNYCKIKLSHASGVSEWFSYCLFLWSTDLEKSQAAHLHCRGIWGECLLLRLVALPTVDNTCVNCLIVGRVCQQEFKRLPLETKRRRFSVLISAVICFRNPSSSAWFEEISFLTRLHFLEKHCGISSLHQPPRVFWQQLFIIVSPPTCQVNTETRPLLFLALSLSILQIHTYMCLYIVWHMIFSYVKSIMV